MEWGPFHRPGEQTPGLSVEEVWSHLRQLDKDVFWTMCSVLDNEERCDYHKVLLHMRQNYPFLFYTLENILRAFQSGYETACETRQHYVETYVRYTAMRDGEVSDGREEEKVLLVKKKKEKKREREEMPEELKEEQKVHFQAAVTSMRNGPEIPEWFYAQEHYSETFEMRKYRHYVKKGHKKHKIQEIVDGGTWATIYHCNGPWQAEMLVENLREEGKSSLILKKIGGADAEVMGFKVLAGVTTLEIE